MDLDPAIVRSGLITYLLLLVSLCIHEWAHAIVADRLGDNTPRNEGRVTLNPMAHIDMLGTVILPLFNIFFLRSAFPFIAWAKPVRVNPSNFKRRVRDDILVTLAGPASNALLALVVMLVGVFIVPAQPRLAELAFRMIVMNVGLAVFNMIPIPPLDGGLIMRHVVGMSEETFMRVSMFSGWVLLILLNVQAFQRTIGAVVAAALIPYIQIAFWIHFSGARFIFP
jgi:Zn-dependent protease